MESNRVGGTPHHENVCHSEYAYAHIQTTQYIGKYLKFIRLSDRYILGLHSTHTLTSCWVQMCFLSVFLRKFMALTLVSSPLYALIFYLHGMCSSW